MWPVADCRPGDRADRRRSSSSMAQMKIMLGALVDMPEPRLLAWAVIVGWPGIPTPAGMKLARQNELIKVTGPDSLFHHVPCGPGKVSYFCDIACAPRCDSVPG